MTKPSVAHDGPVTAIDMHEWDGLPPAEIYADIARKFFGMDAPFNVTRAPKPETAAEFCARMSRFSRKAYRRKRHGA